MSDKFCGACDVRIEPRCLCVCDAAQAQRIADLEAKLREAEAREEAMRKATGHALTLIRGSQPKPFAASKAERILEAALSLPASDHDARVRREALKKAAAIARNFGPSRHPVKDEPRYRDRHLGECAASSSIARLIDELSREI